MAKKTEFEAEMSRSELAAYLHSIADEFEDDDSDVAIRLGNKQVAVSPESSITCEATLTERSRRLRANKGELLIDLSWKRGNRDSGQNNDS